MRLQKQILLTATGLLSVALLPTVALLTWTARQALLERTKEDGVQIAQMLHQLRKPFETLKQRVAERTLELAIAKQKAEVASVAKSTFLANMSHELRIPLNAIFGFSQLMIRSQTLPPEHLENAGIITKSGEHLLTLINQVLDLSKVARYGGDEFAIVLSNTDGKQAVFVAEAIRKEVEQLKIPHTRFGVNQYVTLSIGVTSVIPNQKVDLDALIAHADRALYCAKEQGRN